MTTVPKVVLLILTWNRRDDLLRCVGSLSALRYPNCVPVVIDNASKDDSVAAVRARYPDVEIICNESNLGYAGGNNVGIRWALERGADYVQIINSDTEVTPDMVSELVRVAESDPLIGVVGCRNVLMEDRERLWGAYGRLTFGPFAVRAVGERVADGAGWQVVRDVDWVIGNGYLWSRGALEAIGFIDEEFFGYNEDADWCLRARRGGYRVVYAGTASIVHQGGASSSDEHRRRFPQWYFLGRNGVLLVRKHGSPRQRVRFGLACGSALALRMVRAGILGSMAPDAQRRSHWRAQWRREREYLRGVIDGLRCAPIPFADLGLDDAVAARSAGSE